MKDSLKDFIQQNREAFDDKAPHERNWDSIEASRVAPSRTGLWNSVVVWRAAAVVFMMLSVFFFVRNNKTATRKEVATIQREFGDLESYYSSQISEKTELVNRFQTQTGMTEDEITQNMKKLEAMYLVLKDELRQRPTQDVKDALVLNLLVRIDLLNQQLNKLDKDQHQENTKEKKVNS